jgi:hypothetical protein
MRKKYIKNGEIFESPIKFQKDGKTIITANPDILLENGFEEYIQPESEKPEIDYLNADIEDMIKHVNEQTDEKILNEFSWNGYEFYLTIENQTNFANMFIAKDFLEYPQTIKTKTGFAQLQNKEEVQEFYLAGVNFVKACLEEGWRIKAEREEEIRQRYAEQQTTSE